MTIAFDDALIQRTRELIGQMTSLADHGRMPPPLIQSPKCVRCSLAGICLPDEITLLQGLQPERLEPGPDPDRIDEPIRDKADENETSGSSEKAPASGKIRKLLPARDDALPVYVVGQGNTVRKKGDLLEIWSREESRAKQN